MTESALHSLALLHAKGYTCGLKETLKHRTPQFRGIYVQSYYNKNERVSEALKKYQSLVHVVSKKELVSLTRSAETHFRYNFNYPVKVLGVY